MRTEKILSDGKIHHLTVKNVTRPVSPTTEIPRYLKRFRGRIVLRHAGIITWENDQIEEGLQGFRPVRVKFDPETETATILSL
jgi:hypothetical protein